jgi:hypothetical protein
VYTSPQVLNLLEIGAPPDLVSEYVMLPRIDKENIEPVMPDIPEETEPPVDPLAEAKRLKHVKKQAKLRKKT